MKSIRYGLLNGTELYQNYKTTGHIAIDFGNKDFAEVRFFDHPYVIVNPDDILTIDILTIDRRTTFHKQDGFDYFTCKIDVDVLAWLKQQTHDDFIIELRPDQENMKIYFKSATDAAIFKLWWM